MHEITVDSTVGLPRSVTTTALESLVNHVLKAEGINNPWEVGISFVDDDAMQRAHVEFMDIDEPTDIMTFPYERDEDFEEDVQGGDLLISSDRAAINAADAGWRHEDEIFFVVTHGLLHLNGWDDHADLDREQMLARQLELITSWVDRP